MALLPHHPYGIPGSFNRIFCGSPLRCHGFDCSREGASDKPGEVLSGSGEAIKRS